MNSFSSFHRETQTGRLCAWNQTREISGLNQIDVPLQTALQKAQIETPVYIYNLDHIRRRYRLLSAALTRSLNSPFQIHYAVKANSNSKVLSTLVSEGACVDVVSMGEGERALKAGFNSNQVLFSGVGKTKREIRWALENSLFQVNVESAGELQRICELAEQTGGAINIGFRLNPNVCPETHPYITTGLRENKFGLEAGEIVELTKWLKRSAHSSRVRMRGLSFHIGSQLLNLDPLRESLLAATELQNQLQTDFNCDLDRLDVGGGIGINYESADEAAEENLAADLAESLHTVLETGSNRLVREGTQILLEPGRWLVARSGILVTEVQYIKKNAYKTFVICDAGMNVLMRPCLYEAQHRIEPLAVTQEQIEKPILCDVVGPICESSDCLARDRSLPAIEPGQLLAIMDTGAYGYSMASLYNHRGWPNELSLEGGDLK